MGPLPTWDDAEAGRTNGAVHRARHQLLDLGCVAPDERHVPPAMLFYFLRCLLQHGGCVVQGNEPSVRPDLPLDIGEVQAGATPHLQHRVAFFYIDRLHRLSPIAIDWKESDLCPKRDQAVIARRHPRIAV